MSGPTLPCPVLRLPGPPPCLPFPFLAKLLCSADGMRQRLLESSFHPVQEWGYSPGLGLCPAGVRRNRTGGWGATQGGPAFSQTRGARRLLTPSPRPLLRPGSEQPLPSFPPQGRTSTLFVPDRQLFCLETVGVCVYVLFEEQNCFFLPFGDEETFC